jgi:hypothetical protein
MLDKKAMEAHCGASPASYRSNACTCGATHPRMPTPPATAASAVMCRQQWAYKNDMTM